MTIETNTLAQIGLFDQDVYTLPQPSTETLRITVETITPAIAKELLANNTSNRKLSTTHVEFLAGQMRNGIWTLTGDPIRLSANGRLLDGQHRLTAIVTSDTTQQMVIIRDLPEETFQFMDTGKIRSSADVLDIAQIPNGRLAASFIRMVINYERGIISGTLKNQGRAIGQAVTNSEILEYARNNDVQPYLLNAKTLYREWKVFSGSEYAFLSYVLGQVCQSDADRFLKSLTVGANLSEFSPIFRLRKKLSDYKDNSVTCTPTERLALTFKAWNLFRVNKEVKLLVWGSEQEFPTPA